jgi:hypothetical protein
MLGSYIRYAQSGRFLASAVMNNVVYFDHRRIIA